MPVFRVSNESQTLDDFLRGNKDVQKEVIPMSHLRHRDLIEDLHMQLFAEWETRPEKARLASNAIDAGFKVTSQFPYSPVII
jgi:alcohol oxidase